MFATIDEFFAEVAGSTEEKPLLSYLFQAARMGASLVMITQDGIFPDLPDFTEEQRQAIIASSSKVQTSPYVVRSDNCFYLRKYWELEQKLKKNIQERITHLPEAIHCAFPDGLLPEQQLVIQAAAKQSLVLVTGGPGTGKSFTAAHIILSLFDASDDKNFTVAITAPTGKAAKHLHSKVQSMLGERSVTLFSSTLHSLLGVKPKRDELFPEEERGVFADLVIVDESSMIDLALMAELFASVKPETRLVLLGDRHQLPPVEVGSLFADLCDLLPSHVICLKRCMRSEISQLLSLADDVKEGKMQTVLDLVLPLNSDKIITTILEHYPDDPDLLQEEIAHFCALAPLRKGPFGVEKLNELCLQTFVKLEKRLPRAMPIVLKGNAPQLDLYNGENGLLFNAAKVALFKGREYPIHLLPPYELAYCLTVHKSQGSEFDHVLLIVPQGAEVFGRSVLYTGITRAKQSVQIMAHKETLLNCISKTNIQCKTALHL